MGCVDAGLALQRLGKTPLGVDQAVFAQPAPSAVSYTHLDVYKRQGKAVAVAAGCGARSVCVVIESTSLGDAGVCG